MQPRDDIEVGFETATKSDVANSRNGGRGGSSLPPAYLECPSSHAVQPSMVSSALSYKAPVQRVAVGGM